LHNLALNITLLLLVSGDLQPALNVLFVEVRLNRHALISVNV